MITVVEFRAKQATGSRHMPTDNHTPIIFSSKLIWIDWSTQKVEIFWFLKLYFYSKNQLNLSISFSLKNIKLGQELLLVNFLIISIFEVLYFLQSRPIFGKLQSIQINFDEKMIGV